MNLHKTLICASIASTLVAGNAVAETTIGGYGELHYNNWHSDFQDKDKKELDFHRFVLEFAHDFNDKIRFFSEVELEHALVKDTDDGSGPGELELEQAYIEMDTSDNAAFKAGVFLLPVGIINETHEPPAFYGVERNPVEKYIIPATWWEGGAMYSAYMENGVSYDLAIHSGLYSPTGDIRDGREKVAKAPADSLAYTARIKYTGIAGVEVAGTVQYQSDFSQGLGIAGEAEDGTLLETHVIYSTGGLKLTALYASWDINFNGGTTSGKDSQDGALVEASYKINSNWGVFARQNNWTNNDGINDQEQTDIGFNYWPHEDVVFKADYQMQNDDAGDYDGFNLGVGYQF